jgi:hypothetical protein
VQDVVAAAGKADGGGDGVLAAGEGHVADQQAQEAFALAGRGGRVVPQGGQVGGQAADAGALLLVERGSGGPGGGVVVLGVGQLAQAGVPVGFEGVGDQPVAGVDGQVAAAGLVGGVLGALDRGGAQRVGVLCLVDQLVAGRQGDFQGEGVRVASSRSATAASMMAPGMCWQIGAAFWMPSCWQT